LTGLNRIIDFVIEPSYGLPVMEINVPDTRVNNKKGQSLLIDLPLKKAPLKSTK